MRRGIVVMVGELKLMIMAQGGIRIERAVLVSGAEVLGNAWFPWRRRPEGARRSGDDQTGGGGAVIGRRKTTAWWAFSKIEINLRLRNKNMHAMKCNPINLLFR
jgi:hypothetical protein